MLLNSLVQDLYKKDLSEGECSVSGLPVAYRPLEIVQNEWSEDLYSYKVYTGEDLSTGLKEIETNMVQM